MKSILYVLVIASLNLGTKGETTTALEDQQKLPEDLPAITSPVSAKFGTPDNLVLIIQRYVEVFDKMSNLTDTEEFASIMLEMFKLIKLAHDDPRVGDNFAISIIRNLMGPVHRTLPLEDVNTIALAYLKFCKMYISSSYTSDSFREMLSTAITNMKLFWASLDKNAKAIVLLSYLPQTGFSGDF